MTRKQRLKIKRRIRIEFLKWFMLPFKHHYQVMAAAGFLLKKKSSRGDARLIINLHRTRKLQ